MEQICIWDDNAARIHTIEALFCRKLRELGIEALVMSNSEPPLLARNNLTGRTPSFEIKGLFWNKGAGLIPSEQDIENLLRCAYQLPKK